MNDMNLTLRISYQGGEAKAQIVGLNGAVADLSNASEKLSAAQADASRKAAAYDALSIRSKHDVQREIDKVNAAYKRLSDTGTLAEDELARASAAATAKIAKLNEELDIANGTAKKGEGIISGYTKQMVLFGAAFGAIGELKATVTNFAEFQQSIADLSAITGATGQQLAYLSHQAREMGATTIFTAGQAADAFKLVASAKPDLLSNSKALAEVTHQTLILAEAAGTQLPDAANTLGSALNEFSAGADQAGRFINVLAAGAKYGASEIPDVSEALKIAGTVAHQVGLSFEQTNAAIQVMSQVALKGSLAGTGLRGVLLHLAKQTDSQFKPSVVGLAQAFENLKHANLTTAQAQHLFGTQNVTAGEALVQNADKLGIMTQQLTGTTIALDQAHIRTDTLVGDVKALSSAWQEQQQKVGDDLTPALRSLVQGTTHLISDTKAFTEVVDDLSVALAAMAAKAIIAKAGLSSMTLSFASATTAAKALGEAILPVAAAEGALKIYQAIKEGVDWYAGSQEAAAAATQSSTEAMQLYGHYLIPAGQRLKALGMDLRNIDPRNIDQVRAALHKLNEAAHQTQLETSGAMGSILNAWMKPESLPGGMHQAAISAATQKVISLETNKYEKIADLERQSEIQAKQSLANKLRSQISYMDSERQNQLALGTWTRNEEAKYVQLEKDKYAQIAAISKHAERDAQNRALQKEEFDLSSLAKDRAQKVALGNWTANLEKAYQQARINRALIAESEITKISDQAEQQRLRQKEVAARKAEQIDRIRAAAGMQALTDLASLTSSKNREMFEIGKQAAIAQAAISTYSAANKAYDALASIPYVGPELGAAAAAAAIISGLNRVQQIRSTSFGGGSAGGVSLSAVPTYSAPVPSGTPTAQSVPFNPGQAGSGTTIHFTQNIHAPNATPSTATALAAAGAKIKNDTISAIATDFANGGPLKKLATATS